MIFNPDYFSNASKDLSRANLNAAEKLLQHGVETIDELTKLNIEFTKNASQYYIESFDKSLEVKKTSELRDLIELSTKPMASTLTSYSLKIGNLGNRSASELHEVIKNRVDYSLENFMELIGAMENVGSSAVDPITTSLKTNLNIWQSTFSKIISANAAINENFRDQIESFIPKNDSETQANKSEPINAEYNKDIETFTADTEGGDIE